MLTDNGNISEICFRYSWDTSEMCKPLGAISIETSTTYGTTPAQVAGQLFAMCQKSSTFALAFERRDEGVSGGPGDLSPKIRDFRGLHKGKAMRSDEDSLRRLVAVRSEQWANAKALWLFDFLTLSLFANAKANAKALRLLVSLTLSLLVSLTRITVYCFSKTVLNGI